MKPQYKVNFIKPITQENTIFLATLNSLARAWPSFKELHLLQQGVSFRYFASHGELVESIFRLFNLFPNLHINVDSGCSTFFNFFFALQVRRNFLSERQCRLVVLIEFQALTNSKGKPLEEIRVEYQKCAKIAIFWTQPPMEFQAMSCKVPMKTKYFKRPLTNKIFLFYHNKSLKIIRLLL